VFPPTDLLFIVGYSIHAACGGREESDVGTRCCIPRMRGPTPRQRAMPSALLSDHAACTGEESDVGMSHTPERAHVPGPPDPMPSALPNKKGRPFVDKLVLNASTR